MYLSKKHLRYLGFIATLASLGMYVSYIPQIIDNINDLKTNPIQPLAAAINCSLWVSYALFKKEKDWPLAIANLPGIFFGLMAFITAL